MNRSVEKVVVKKQEKVIDSSVASKGIGVQVSRKRRASALSLKKIHNKLTDIDYVTGDDDYSNKPKDHFSEIQLIEKWKVFSNKLKEDSELNMFSILNANRPILKKEEVVFELPNSLMEEQFGVIKSRLLNFLRTELNNYGIQIKTQVVETEKKRYIYTPQEKFTKLVESNPHVLLLKNKFGLNI